jgi:hypothetical protein
MKLLLQVVINGLLTSLLGAVVLGLFGFLVAGTAGVANGLAFGAVFGFVGGMAAVGFIGGTYWWTGIFSRYGAWRHRRESGEDQS